MKNIILLVGTVMLLCVAVSAQQAEVGVTGKGLKLGFGFAKINTEYTELDELLDSRDGFIGGAYLTYNFNRQFAVQPEILYASKGAEKDVIIFGVEWAIDYLEVPVLLKFNIAPDRPVSPSLFIGPAVSMLLSSKIHVNDEKYDVKDGMKSLDIGLVFGGGVDYKHVTFDLRYTLGLVNIIDAGKVNTLTGAEPDDFYYLEGDPSVKNTNISFMVGVRF